MVHYKKTEMFCFKPFSGQWQKIGEECICCSVGDVEIEKEGILLQMCVCVVFCFFRVGLEAKTY